MRRGRQREARLLKADGTVACERCILARSMFARMRGLLGRRSLAPEEGMMLRPASSVHTWFMRFPIDVVFLNRNLTVLRIVPALRPWRAAWRWRASAVLELAAGESERRGIRAGDSLHWGDK